MGRSSWRKNDVLNSSLNLGSANEKRTAPAVDHEDLLVRVAVEGGPVAGWCVYKDQRQVSSMVAPDEVACLIAAR